MSRFGMAVWLLLIVALLLLVAARSAHNEPLILVDAAAQTCRLHTAPSPCDGKCTRQHSRSYT